MSYTILLSGDRANFTTVSFDANQKKLAVTANYPSPFNASWVEPSSSLGPTDRLIGLSEGIESGSLYTFEIDHQQKTCKITSLQTTLGAPAHCKRINLLCLPKSHGLICPINSHHPA